METVIDREGPHCPVHIRTRLRWAAAPGRGPRPCGSAGVRLVRQHPCGGRARLFLRCGLRRRMVLCGRGAAGSDPVVSGVSPVGGPVRDGEPDAFTVIACHSGACQPPPDLPVLDMLRAVVRQCPYAVLVSADCPLRGACPGLGGRAAFGAGATLLVQPCRAADRVPSGAAVQLGPIRTRSELQDACAWIARQSGQGDPPPHLPRPRRARPSALN